MTLKSFSCVCPPLRAKAGMSTFRSKSSGDQQRTAQGAPPQHTHGSAQAPTVTLSETATNTLKSKPSSSSTSDTASTSSSQLSPAQTIGVVLASIFGTLVSILICRRFWVEWRMYRRRRARRTTMLAGAPGTNNGDSRQSSRSSSRRSVWEWVSDIGTNGKEQAKGVLTLGSGFRHRHIRTQKNVEGGERKVKLG